MAEAPGVKFKNSLISPNVQKEIDAQDPANPKPIPVILVLWESRNDPELGIAHSKLGVKAFLDRKKCAFRESEFYLFASLLPADIKDLATNKEWIYRIWKDETTYTHLLESTQSIKAPACWRTFEALGRGITWAVLDTGIKYAHPHLAGCVDLMLSKNFSNSPDIEDKNGHGTHVAGIIAGGGKPKADGTPYKAATFVAEEDDPDIIELNGYPSGVAPLTTLINVKVLDDNGSGSSSNAILALEYLRKLNQSSRSIKVDGANLSMGYPFDPKWYGCGHSPLCDEVARAVASGIIVVISCGNSGYGTAKLDTGQEVPTWIALSITDPANTEDAIAVGSAHKSKPHTFGISYFSSKGPTGDGRQKPDLVAPGEKVISCSICLDQGYEYQERSGTSMAAPHVSGAAAAFLSVHPEFRGDPGAVKSIFLKTATDLGRNPAFQGAGLIDLMRAITSV
jgi:serine protease AprX